MRTLVIHALVFSLCLFLTVAACHGAADVYVRTDGDDTTCSGLVDASAAGAPDCAFATVGKGLATVDANGTVHVGAGTFPASLTVSKNVTFQGAGQAATILDGGKASRVMETLTGITVEVLDLAIHNGFAASGAGIRNAGTMHLTQCTVASNRATSYGGGITNSPGTMTLDDCLVKDNRSEDYAGGILTFSGATMTIDGSTVEGNRSVGDGAGVQNYAATLEMSKSSVVNNVAESGLAGGVLNNGNGTLTLEDCMVSGNQSIRPTSAAGGGIFNDGTATLTRVAVVRNQSTDSAAGIHNQNTLNMINVTISGNTAVAYAAGLLHTGNAKVLTAANSTIAGNLLTSPSGPGVGGGVLIYSTVNWANMIVAGNDANECQISGSGSATSGGGNLSSDATCNFTDPSDQTDTDPLLAPLDDNGGDTLTHALVSGSPAIDMGVDAACPDDDQRGMLRPAGEHCDSGAFELHFRAFLAFVKDEP